MPLICLKLKQVYSVCANIFQKFYRQIEQHPFFDLCSVDILDSEELFSKTISELCTLETYTPEDHEVDLDRGIPCKL